MICTYYLYVERVNLLAGLDLHAQNYFDASYRDHLESGMQYPSPRSLERAGFDEDR